MYVCILLGPYPPAHLPLHQQVHLRSFKHMLSLHALGACVRACMALDQTDQLCVWSLRFLLFDTT